MMTSFDCFCVKMDAKSAVNADSRLYNIFFLAIGGNTRLRLSMQNKTARFVAVAKRSTFLTWTRHRTLAKASKNFHLISAILRET